MNTSTRTALALTACALALTACTSPDETVVVTEVVTSTTAAAVDREEPDTAEPEQASAPREHSAALQSARDYLDYTSFSRQGLYDQLIFEQYPPEAAQYAVDNVQADWNDNALRSARDYLAFMDMSDGELHDQLIFEGYTAEEASYAVANL